MKATFLAIALAAALAAAGCGGPETPPVAEAPVAVTMADVDAVGERYNAARLALAQAATEGRLDLGIHEAVIAETRDATYAALMAAAAAVTAGHEDTARQWFGVARKGVARMEMYLGAIVEAAPATWRGI